MKSLSRAFKAAVSEIGGIVQVRLTAYLDGIFPA